MLSKILKYYSIFTRFIDDIKIYSYKDIYADIDRVNSIKPRKIQNVKLQSLNIGGDSNYFLKSTHLNVNNDKLQTHINKDTDSKIYEINQNYFSKIYAYMNATNIQYMQNKLTFFKKYMSSIFSLKIDLCTLSPDNFSSIQIDVKKSQLRQEYATDIIVPLKAKNLGLMPIDCECRYFMQKQTRDSIYFQLFYIVDSVIQTYVLHNKNKMIFFNIFDIFSTLHMFFPLLTKYTIIFQDVNTHAICHYNHGLLETCILVDKKESLQNYHANISDFGEMFYCNFDDKENFLYDFTPIQTLFNMPLNECIKFLSIHNLYTKPIETSFYPQAFYSMKNKLKVLFFCIILFFSINLSIFLYNKIQYYNFIKQQNEDFYTHVSQQYNKKKIYPYIYDRIYNNLLNRKDLNFCLEQQYMFRDNKFVWVESNCNKNR